MLFAKKTNNPTPTMADLMNLTKKGSGRNKFIRMVDFITLNQIDEIKMELKKGNIMILNASEVLNTNRDSIMDLKRGIDDLKRYCHETGGTIGRIGDSFLIITPDNSIRIK